MRIRYELLALIAMLGVTAALLQPTQQPHASAGASLERSSLEAQAPRHVETSVRSAAAQAAALRREQTIDAERLRLIARGELSAREATPAELRLIRSGGLPPATATVR